MNNAHLELIIGPMFAGKTSTLLGIIRRYNFIGYTCFTVTHSSDTRYSKNAAEIVSHNQDSLSAHPVRELLPLLNETAYKTAKVIAIEEAHFFPDLYEFVLAALEKDNKHVICVGLNGDYLRKPIGQICQLIPLADNITKIDALCTHCKEPRAGIFTLRRSDSGSGSGSGSGSSKQLLVGGAETYEAVCRAHFIAINQNE
jgi:thymidine kinase